MAVLREIQGPVGRLEVLLDEPPALGGSPEGLVISSPARPIRAAVVFHHPHPQFGGTMHTKTVYQAAKALARIGCVVLRFNCRGVGKSGGQFDDGHGEMDDFKAALDVMHQRYPGAPLWAAGMSFGSWVGLSVGANDPRVSLLLGIAMPVNNYDFSAVAASTKPKFFIHGEFDEICSEKHIREFYARSADPKELAIIEGSDHLFDGKVSQVADAVEDLLGDWPS
ncbi:MAG: alpha/beta hydrolase [Vicinamibacterales bacterium]